MPPASLGLHTWQSSQTEISVMPYFLIIQIQFTRSKGDHFIQYTAQDQHPMSGTMTLRQKYMEVLSKTFHQQCLNTCTPKIAESTFFSEDEKKCLKNCGSKILNYSKVAKSVGFPIS